MIRVEVDQILMLLNQQMWIPIYIKGQLPVKQRQNLGKSLIIK